MSEQYREGFRDGAFDAAAGRDFTTEVQEDCGDPETCDYCRGYSDGQTTTA